MKEEDEENQPMNRSSLTISFSICKLMARAICERIIFNSWRSGAAETRMVITPFLIKGRWVLAAISLPITLGQALMALISSKRNASLLSSMACLRRSPKLWASVRCKVL